MLDFFRYFDYTRNMIEIKRTFYLERLHRFIETPTIVVVTGLRRVGKSILLRQFADEMRSETDVVYIDKESLDFDTIRSSHDLINYVDPASRKGVPRVLIIDEVQEIQDWERATAALLGSGNTRILVSGSNASLLSGELATRIAGRYLTFQVFPLTLREFGDLYRLTGKTNVEGAELFRIYLRLGGLPGILHTDLSEIVVNQMLRDVFNTIALRDVVSRHRIRNVRLFEDVVMFLMDNIGSLISAKRISDFMKSQRRDLSVDTVLNYLSYLQDAFLCEIVNRFDIKGRRRMEVNNKLYLGDIGLRNGLLGFRERDISGILENLVYLELRRRGFTVSVGSLGEREIDFVAEKESGRFYIQVAYQLGARATISREIKPLSDLHDAYPRILMSMDQIQPRDLNGIQHRGILDFLLGAEL
jgi:predicted AAA+ superfamily ATPase